MADSLISGEQAPVNESIPDAATQSAAPLADPRPDWLPEKFWVEGKPAFDQLAKSYGELETRFRSKEDDLRAKLIEELSAEAINARPETPEKYELPAFEGYDPAEMAGHPLTKWWSEFSYENGFDQEAFGKGVEMYLAAQAQTRPDPAQELAKLGDNASARAEAVGLWVSTAFDASEISHIERLCTTAEGVKVMEKVMALVRGQGAPDLVTQAGEDVTEADITRMMQDRRYWSPSDRDPSYIAKVEQHFKKKFGQAAR